MKGGDEGSLRGDKESVFIADTTELLLDAADYEPLGVVKMQPLLHFLKARKRRASPFVQDRLHGLFPDPGKQFQEVESSGNRRRLVDEAEILHSIRPDDLFQCWREFRPGRRSEFFVADAATNVINRGSYPAHGKQGYSTTRGEACPGPWYHLEELELGFPNRQSQRFLMVSSLGLSTGRQEIENVGVGFRGRSLRSSMLSEDLEKSRELSLVQHDSLLRE